MKEIFRFLNYILNLKEESGGRIMMKTIKNTEKDGVLKRGL